MPGEPGIALYLTISRRIPLLVCVFFYVQDVRYAAGAWMRRSGDALFLQFAYPLSDKIKQFILVISKEVIGTPHHLLAVSGIT